jgi:hypothetical protein
MKTRYPFFILLASFCWSLSFSQEKVKYTTTIIEFPITWANVSANGDELGGPVRFAPFFNFQNNFNVDFNEKAGFFIGLGIHNVGFIYDIDEFTRKKVRSYNLGIPVGVKFGDMDRAYIYGGYEFEIPFHYKEKTFINEEKSKFGTWFSDRTPLQQSFMIGVQLPEGANIKFKYYFSNFYKKNYTASNGQGGTFNPYDNFNANVFWISLNIVLFRNTEFTYEEYIE